MTQRSEGELTAGAREIENRLTRLEMQVPNLEDKIESGFDGVNRRLDTMNGNVARLVSWQGDHMQAHATQDGIRAGRVEVETKWLNRDKASFALFLTLLTFGVNIGVKVWG